MEKRLLKSKDLAVYLSTSLSYARDYGRRVGASRYVGRVLLFDRVVIDRALDELQEGDDIREVRR